MPCEVEAKDAFCYDVLKVGLGCALLHVAYVFVDGELGDGLGEFLSVADRDHPTPFIMLNQR